MKILTGQQLVSTLRKSCDKVTKRLWIASPFIGYWSKVRRILGRKWVDDGQISVRLITDFSDNSIFDYETIKCFHDRGAIKEIKGLHAKIFIIDDAALVTSANLTNTAFTKRYEVGILLLKNEASEIIRLYEKWWKEIALNIPSLWLPKIARRRVKTEKEETPGRGLEVLWELPSDPGNPVKTIPQRFLDYETFLTIYKDFANRYEQIQRIWPSRHLYFETDSFLNYLFHHAPGLPTKKYIKTKPRQLTEDEKQEEIKKYTLLFKKWLSEGSEEVETKQWREIYSKTIKELLRDKNIGKLTRQEVKKAVNCLNCMNSMPIMKFKFLNPKNNDLEDIKTAWKELLYGQAALPVRMSDCLHKLKFFGRSSIHEIIGNFNPSKYPLRNRNSNAGLRFFGYDVSAY